MAQSSDAASSPRWIECRTSHFSKLPPGAVSGNGTRSQAGEKEMAELKDGKFPREDESLDGQ